MHKALSICNAKVILACAVVFFFMLCAADAFAQKLPPTEGPAPGAGPKKPFPKPPTPPRPPMSILVIKTDPKEATVEIGGQPANKTASGEFSKELIANKKYTVKVAAGPDYQTKEQQITIKAGQPNFLEVVLTYKYGVVDLGPIIPGATLYMDDRLLPSEMYKTDESSRRIVINKIPEGEHRFKYYHPDYVILENKYVITPGSHFTWTFLPERATVELRVKTEAGAAVYIDREPRGTTTSDGSLKLRDIRIGEHEIKITKDGFQEYTETRQFAYDKPVEITRQLEPLATSTSFQDDFDIPNTSRWTMPSAGWSIKSGRLYIADSPTVGFPTGLRYADFTMHFLLHLTNAGGAAWALRIKDSSNYYLFYLSGPEGLFQNRFLTYVVVDNKFDPNAPVDSVAVPLDLKAGGDYTIDITASKNRIEQTITPAATGERLRLGFFEDPNSRWLYGNIGFRTVGREQFAIDELFVVPKTP